MWQFADIVHFQSLTDTVSASSWQDCQQCGMRLCADSSSAYVTVS